MKRQPPPTEAETIIQMSTLAGVSLKAKGGRLELVARGPVNERLAKLIERHRAAIVRLLGASR